MYNANMNVKGTGSFVFSTFHLIFNKTHDLSLSVKWVYMAKYSTRSYFLECLLNF